MKLFLIGLLMAAVISGIFSRWQKKEEPDQQVLDQLRKAGSNLSKPHNIEFFLYFPNEALANQAAKDVKAEVDSASVRLGADKKDWLCYATKRMIPKYDDLVRLRRIFNGIAAKYGGQYDGWGTEVVK